MLFDLIHDHGGVRFNRPLFLVTRVVRALPRIVNDTVMNHHGHDDVFLTARLAFTVQFADPILFLGRTLCDGPRGQDCSRQTERGEQRSEARSKSTAGESQIHDCSFHPENFESLSNYGKAKLNRLLPAAIATYCLPPTA